MATFTARLTPHTDQTPVVVEVSRELSGAHWCSRFLGSDDPSTLSSSFKLSVISFIKTLEQAGAYVKVNNTLRPKERAYLMHWSWMIWHDGIDPATIPPKDGVLIEWVHPTRAASVKAADDMASAFDIKHLGTHPALKSLHESGDAVDMNISWQGTLKIKNVSAQYIEITSLPRSGMNSDLKYVGKSYGVIKFIGGNLDRPHWSKTGR